MNSILIASQGSQGVVLLRELFGLGIAPKDIDVITFESKFNNPFLEFLLFNKMNFTVIEDNKHLEVYFKNHSYDFLISLSYRFIFSKDCLSKIKFPINFHPGILPEYKGSYSIPWSIIKGEEFVGYTYHFMVEKVDSGPILQQEKFPIYKKSTSHNLNYLVLNRGIMMIGKVLEKARLNQYEQVEMNSGTFYSNKLPFNGEINRDWDLDRIEKFIKAMYFPPFEPAFLNVENTKLYFENFSDYLKYLENAK